MMKPDFTTVVIGDQDDSRCRRLRDELAERTQALGDADERFEILAHDRVGLLAADTRAAAVVFCRKGMTKSEIDAIDACRKRNVPIFPVVSDLKTFTEVTPQQIAALNGYALADIADTGELAGLVLEILGLQRGKRKIFISYARIDSTDIARQLREAFTARWYSVFVDTVSIRPGAEFQDELLQELADSDVMVLLNSPRIKDRLYVQKEIAFADQAGVGGVQVIWPGDEVKPLREGAFFMPVKLDSELANSAGGRVTDLTQAGITKILRTVADLRTALQQQREARLVRPVTAYAQAKSWRAVTHPGRYVELCSSTERLRLDLAFGVPTSHDLERAFRTAEAGHAKGRLIYDPLGITNNQSNHLNFLGLRLGLQFLDPSTALQWTLIP